jgi:mono/diheme cytochrome c family protein
VQAGWKRYFYIGLVSLVVLVIGLVVPKGAEKYAAGAEDGKKLFESNCISCHSIGGGKGVGPDLNNVGKSRDQEWLKKMIHDPKALVDSGDPTVKQLVEEYGMVMPKINLNDSEINAIIQYLNNPNPGGDAANGGKATESGQKQLSITTFAFSGLFGAILFFAILAGLRNGILKGVRKTL